MQDAVAIIGMGARFPGASDATAFRRLVRTGSVHIRPVPAERWDHSVVGGASRREPNRTPARAGAFMEAIDRFCPEFFGVTPKRARVMDPQQRLMLEIVRHALEDAGYGRRSLAGGRTGVYVGACSSDHRTLVAGAVNIPCDLAGRSGVAPRLTAEEFEAVTAGLPPIQAYSIVGQQLNMIAANVSQAFDWKGPAFAVDTACSSALVALHEAVVHLRAGLVDAALVGGVYVQLDPIMMVCFSRIGALSFSDRCRPFQLAADGFVMGEGVGAVVLKRLADAQRDGDRIVAVIRGIAANNDGGGAGPLTPRAGGQRDAIAQAWQQAGIDPGSVGLLEAHATGTQAGDRIELEALTEVFGAQAHGQVPISSIKANIGHGLASAGMASLLKATLAVHDGFIPPQPVEGDLRAEFAGSASWLRVPTQIESWRNPSGEPRRAGVSAFGFGGTNVHVVLEEAPPVIRLAAPRPQQPRFRLSAPNAELLKAYAGHLAAALREHPEAAADVAHTLARRRPDAVQTTVLASDLEDLRAHLAGFEPLPEDGAPPAEDGEAVDEPGRLVLLPPSPLAQRRFWLIDSARTRPAQPAGSAAPTATTGSANLAPVGPGYRERIIAAVTEVTARPPDEIRPEHRFAADLGFDSLTTLDFMTVLGRSLPGITPPRTLFTPALTVQALADYLEHAGVKPADAGRAVGYTFARTTHPWFGEHRPGNRSVLPLSALITAALASRPVPGGIVDFKVLAPLETAGDEVTLERTESAGGFELRRSGQTMTAARGEYASAGPVPELLASTAASRGMLALPRFYQEFGFHGPALQALVEEPLAGATTVEGRWPASPDPVVWLDGVLQLALYWLASNRGQQAVVTGFAEFRQLTAWPTAGTLHGIGRLVEADAMRLRGDFDVRTATGELVLVWRGVEAQIIAPAAAEGPAAWPEVRELAARTAALAAGGFAMPYFHVHEGVAAATTRIGGREFVNFSSYNYLGLAGDPAVNEAAAAAAARYGTSASASRIASGERPLHRELEQAIAGFLGCDDALTLVGGHATNVSLIGHLFGPEDVVIHDSLAHDCIMAGARLSGARRLAFPHNDVATLANLLRQERPKARRILIAVEGVYSMDGDCAPLDAIVELKLQHGAMLLVDEAHSLGVLGATGRGAGEHFGVPRRGVDLWMGTLSKTLASCGGYVAGEAALIDYLRFTLPGFVFSVGMPPPSAAAALAALRQLMARPHLPRQLQERSDCFRALCRARGIDIGASCHSAVVPCITGSSVRALQLSQDLAAQGINVQPVIHPAVEEGKARLRFFVTAGHSEAQLRLAADAVAAGLAKPAEVWA